MRLCELDGCGGKHFGRGLCHKHYMRKRRHGDPHDPGRSRAGTDNGNYRGENVERRGGYPLGNWRKIWRRIRGRA